MSLRRCRCVLTDITTTLQSAFATQMGNSTINWNTRVSWKYGCSRGISGTPMFLINGVPVAGDPGWKQADWEVITAPLLGNTAQRRSSGAPNCPSGETLCRKSRRGPHVRAGAGLASPC